MTWSLAFRLLFLSILCRAVPPLGFPTSRTELHVSPTRKSQEFGHPASEDDRDDRISITREGGGHRSRHSKVFAISTRCETKKTNPWYLSATWRHKRIEAGHNWGAQKSRSCSKPQPSKTMKCNPNQTGAVDRHKDRVGEAQGRHRS